MAELGEFNYTINLRDIKSSYIIKRIFSFLCEKLKLIMIINNKNLQKILSVGLKDYKRRSGKYKIGGKNGKGREYFFNINMFFEGNYINGKKHGKGKEYYNDILRFEGEYINGRRCGKGKEYYNNGIIKFEGEYKNGRLWNGKEYTICGNKAFEIKNGKGYIVEYDIKGKLRFEGEILNEKQMEKGKNILIMVN